jgi:hypothetical protein
MTSREMFDMLLEQGHNYILSDRETFNDPSRFNQLQKDNRNQIVDYFMNINVQNKIGRIKVLLAHLHFIYLSIPWIFLSRYIRFKSKRIDYDNGKMTQKGLSFHY